MKFKHSKKRNTGLLFELLAQQMTNDIMSGDSFNENNESPAAVLLQKYFVKTQLGKELKLYKKLMESNTITESKANILLDTVLKHSTHLSRKQLRQIKYNLCNEIQTHYDEKEFYSKPVGTYKRLASIYKLFEYYNTNNDVDTDDVINNKVTILEYLTKEEVKQSEVESKVLQEFKTSDPEIRSLAYQISIDKFNNKYDGYGVNQKSFLNEFIKSDNSVVSLRNLHNKHASIIRESILSHIKVVDSDVTKIYLEEVVKYISDIDKTKKPEDKNFVDILEYYNLVNRLDMVHA